MVWILIKTAITSTIPIMLAAEGATISELSGVINIALEGIMLLGAFFGALSAYYSNSWFIGLLVSILVGASIGLLHAYISIDCRGDQIISGTGINVVAVGLTNMLLKTIFKHAGTTPNVPPIPHDMPGGLNILDLFSLLLPFFLWWFYYYTPWGLRTRSVGEDPEVSEIMGISVRKVRYISVITSSILASLGGAYLSLGVVGLFQQNMSGGRGFLGLAAMIFGNWNPIGSMIAAIFFGSTYALQMYMQIRFYQFNIPPEVFLMLPYILAILALIGVMGKSHPPSSDGKPYTRQK